MPSNDTPTLGDIIITALDTRSRNTAVALPGTVQSYNASSGTCTVKPGVNRMVPSFDDEDLEVSEELPSLQDVPVVWLVARGIRAKGTLQAGDPVLLIAMDRDMSGWQRTGRHQDPEDSRMHSWSSCVAIPGLLPNTNPIPVPTDAAALASKLDEFFQTVALLNNPTDLGSLLTAVSGILVAARVATGVPMPATSPGVGGGTVGSDVLLLDS